MVFLAYNRHFMYLYLSPYFYWQPTAVPCAQIDISERYSESLLMSLLATCAFSEQKLDLIQIRAVIQGVVGVEVVTYSM